MKQLLLVLSTFFLLTLGGCGYVPPHMVLNDSAPTITPNASKATLVVTRQRTILYGSGADVNVFLDEEFIGQTTFDSYFIKLVDPGVHYVFSYAVPAMGAAPISTVRFDFQAGKIYYLRHSVREPPLSFTTFTTTEAIAPGDLSLVDMGYMDFNSNGGAVVLPDVDRKEAIKEFEDNPNNYQEILKYKGY